MTDFETLPFTVVVDTREQIPWQFKTMHVQRRVVVTQKMASDLELSGMSIQDLPAVGSRITQKQPLVVPTRTMGMETGDYQIIDTTNSDGPCVPPYSFTLERKSFDDALGTFTDGRDRFERELERMKSYDFAAVMLEFPYSWMIHRIPEERKVRPETLDESVRAWRQRYGVHFLFHPSRVETEKSALQEMRRFWNDQRGKKDQWKWQVVL